MSGCEKIERLIWEYPGLSASDREKLSSHIETCPSCKADLESISALKNSRDNDREMMSVIDPVAFDNAVMAKIAGRKKRAISRSDDRRFILRTAASVGLAAAIVVFMIVSISDLGNLPSFKKSVPAAGRAEYDLMEIRLKPAETLKAPQAPARASAEKAAKEERFSILDKPVVSPSPESVNIGAVYLSDENVPIFSQQIRASISEVVVDTGVIQAVRAPEAVFVTVEKMPRPIEIVPPEYPVWGMKRGLSSVVWVKAHIDENGTVTDAEVVSSSTSGAGFEDAAVEAALKSRYQPAEANGIRIPVWIMYPVKFIYRR